MLPASKNRMDFMHSPHSIPEFRWWQIGRIRFLILLACSWPAGQSAKAQILDPADYACYVKKFNRMEDEPVVNQIPNPQAWDWIVANAPLFDCPSTRFEEIYYYRWWTYRKHIKQTPDGLVLTEFITPVGHAGPHNTISCALGHHLAEGRWLRDQQVLDEYTHFWFRSNDGKPAMHFHKYSSWAADAIYQRFLVTGNRAFLVDLLDDLIADYEAWESERGLPDGLFWQHDVKDGMEESISGGRREKNVRPTINSYMAANARAIARIAELSGRSDVARQFDAKYSMLRTKMIDALWDPEAGFFKVRFENGNLSDAREAIGFIPWMFGLADEEHAAAWQEIKDPNGFWAPWGLTTAERRHPKFRSHGTGTCEWDGAVWPFATSQTLNGLIQLLQGPNQSYVTRRDFFGGLLTYARSHQQDGKAYLGEYLDESTGQWLITGPKAQRSRYYNHSTFNDLVIRGLAGLIPSEDNTVVIDPLIPPDAWEWFCLDRIPYHGRLLSIVWDRTGQRYHRAIGWTIWCDGKPIAQSPELTRLTAQLPAD
ncbi:MAG: hypothetical protein JW829_10610 [Pirellulales bacterium]|nr:hypothetical protein [Pirellulales bacterium]